MLFYKWSSFRAPEIKPPIRRIKKVIIKLSESVNLALEATRQMLAKAISEPFVFQNNRIVDREKVEASVGTTRVIDVHGQVSTQSGVVHKIDSRVFLTRGKNGWLIDSIGGSIFGIGPTRRDFHWQDGNIFSTIQGR